MKKRKRRKLALATVFILVTMAFFVVPGNVSAADLEVGPGKTYTTIQSAIDAASDGDTIYVDPGTYVESITIGKSVKLIAPGGATIQSPSTCENVYLAESSKLFEYLVGLLGGTYDAGTDTVSGTDTITVEMSGFTLDANQYIPSQRFCTILCRNVNTDHSDGIASVHDNDIINIYVNGKETFGILGYGDMDIIVQDNTINQFARGGIGVMSGSAQVLGNTVTGPGLGIPVTWAPNGIQLGYGASGLIQGNDVSGCGWPGTAWAGTGIMVVDTSNVVVDDNYIHDNEQAIGITDFPEALYGSTWAGSVSDIAVTGNLLEDNTWGISIVNEADNIDVVGNDIYDCVGDAIDVFDYTYYYPSYEIPSPTDVDIHYNRIEGSGGDGLWVGSSVTETVEASHNWWNHATGPDHTSNPHGSGQGGETVIGNANVVPWYATDTTTPLSEYVSVIHNPIIAYSDTIQGGVDAALDGDTVQISGGTYVIGSQILIDKGLNVIGDPVNNPVINAGNTISPYMMRVDSSVTTPVHISNIIFDGIGQNVYGALRLGSSNSGSVTGCTFQNIRYSIYRGFAIVLYGDSYLIENNVLSNIERVGIWVGLSAKSNTLIKNNVYTGKGNGNWIDYGIEVGYGGIATIQGNIITDCTGVAASDGSTSAGILVSTYFGPGTQATIIGNTISGNTVGIHVGYLSSDTSTVVAHCNNILDNTDYGVYSTGPQVDATTNWWGEISGPYHPTLNPSGTGNAVGDHIDFEPWSYRTDPCQPKSKGFWKTHLDAVDALLSEYGPVYLGDFEVVDSTIAYEIFANAKAKNANTMLAAELLATKLNILQIAHLGLDGSISYWALDEGSGTTAYDTVDANDGSLVDKNHANADGNTPPQWTDGISGNALDYDGVDDYVNIPDANNLDITEQITLEAWIKPSAIYTGGNWKYDDVIVAKRMAYYLRIDENGKLAFYAYGVTTWVTGSDMTPYLDTWVHVAATYDGSTVRLYINGQLDKSVSRSGSIQKSIDPVTIGYVNYNRFFDGIIDEARIYNKALCPSLISLHHTMGLADQFLSNHDYDGPSDPGKVKGPEKEEALALKDILEAFNTGDCLCCS